MTNAIEQTKRVMYLRFGIVKDLADDAGASPSIHMQDLENAMEEHFEALRQDRAKIIEERDELRNKHQALQMASQTAAEVIRGLRSELLEARECNATDKQSKGPENSSEMVRALRSQVVSLHEVISDMMLKRSETEKLLHEERSRILSAGMKLAAAQVNGLMFAAFAGALKENSCQHSYQKIDLGATASAKKCIYCGEWK